MSKILSGVVAALFGLISGALAASVMGPSADGLERTVVGALAGALTGMFTGSLAGELESAKSADESRAPATLLIGLLFGILGATQSGLVHSILIDLGVR